MKKTVSAEVEEARSYKVVKANEMVQKARYDLGITELKTLSFIISKIKPTDTMNTIYSFTINEYCRVLGIDSNNGGNIQVIKKALQTLRDTSFWMTLENGTETTVGWLGKLWLDRGSGKVSVRLDEDLQRFVIGLYKSKNFTQYELLSTLPMRSAYSIRIYELVKSYANQQTHIFKIDYLKRKLACEHYVNFKDFRRKVLEVATKEINLYTDLTVSWEPVTHGRKVIEVEFTIKTKSTFDRWDASIRASEQLDGQLSIADVYPELCEQ